MDEQLPRFSILLGRNASCNLAAGAGVQAFHCVEGDRIRAGYCVLVHRIDQLRREELGLASDFDGRARRVAAGACGLAAAVYLYSRNAREICAAMAGLSRAD